MAPTLTDQQLGEEIHEVAENLAGFRVEVAEKFGAANTRLESFRTEVAEKFGAANARLESFRTEVAEKFGAANARLESFRTEVAEKFGAANTRLELFRTEVTEKFGATDARLEAFRSEIKAELSEKFGAADAHLEAFRSELKESLAEKFGAADTRHGTFRSEVETNLKFIRWIGTFFAGLLVSIFIGLITLAWHASALNSDVTYMERHHAEVVVEVEAQGAGIEKLERQIDGISKQLELLIRQTSPKAGGDASVRDTEARVVQQPPHGRADRGGEPLSSATREARGVN